MKKIIIILLFFHASNISGQTNITAGAGYSQRGSVVELTIGRSFKGHNLLLTGNAHLSGSQPKYAAVGYGYTIGLFMPYIGFGYQNFNDQKSKENRAWNPRYGVQVNFNPKEDAPAGIYLNAGAVGSELLATAGIHLTL